MKNLRFLSITAILALVLAGVIGIGKASAQTVCSPATPISMPFSKDGMGTFCWQTTTLCDHINSWQVSPGISINGTNYSNIFAYSSSIPPLNGGYTITYNSTATVFAHFEIDGPCGGSGPTLTPTKTLTSAWPTLTSTRTPTLGGPTATRTPTQIVGASRTATTGPSLTATRTATRIPTTPAFTPTRTPTAGQGVSLKVQYMPGDANASTTAIHPKIRVVNTGSVSVALDDINLYYWYTAEVTTQTQTWTCISATIPGGCSNIVGDAYSLSPVRPAADAVLIDMFVIGIGDLAPGQSFDIEYTITKSDGSLYTQTGDYSFNPSFTTYTDWPKITLFYDPSYKVIWGTEPIAPTMTPTVTPTATQPGGICSPVTADITAPFIFSGQVTPPDNVVGTHCWRLSGSFSFINSFNLALLTINGVNFTNIFVSSGGMPAQIGGYWYITHVSNVPWGHFEVDK